MRASAFAMLLAAAAAAGQEPVAWWRFESSAHLGADSSPGGANSFVSEPFSPEPEPPFSQETADGCVGGYLHVGGANVSLALAAETAKPIPAATAPGLTAELLFRLNGTAFNKAGNTTVLRGGSGEGGAGWALAFDRHSIGFRAAGRVVSAQLIGSGVRSIFGLADGAWHHLACRLDASSGEQSIWIDGQCPDPHPPTCPPPCTLGGSLPPNASAAPGQVPAGAGAVTLLPSAFDGDLDEIAVYTAALSNSTIWAHFQGAVQQHTKYSFSPSTAPVPPPAPAGGALNASDFPPGTILPTPDGNSSVSGSNMTLPIDQLKAFPAPRYLLKPKTGPKIGTPQRNFNWMDPGYMVGTPYDLSKSH